MRQGGTPKVALKELFPTDPDDRATVEKVLREHPRTARFVERLQEHARHMFGAPVITLSTRQYDDWDPPLTVSIYADFPPDEFEDRYLQLVRWMNDNPDYDLDAVTVLLRRRSSEATGR